MKHYREHSQALRRLRRVIKPGVVPEIMVSRCLHENTLVLLANGSLRKISELSTGDRIIDGQGQPTIVRRVFDRGTKDRLVRLRTDRMLHPITCTHDHRVLVLDVRGKKKTYSLEQVLRKSWAPSCIRWVMASELTQETYPLTPLDLQIFCCPPVTIDMAQFAGRSTKVLDRELWTPGHSVSIGLQDIADRTGATYWQVAEVSRERVKFTKSIHCKIREELDCYQEKFCKKISRFLPVNYQLGLLFGAYLGDGYARERLHKGGNITLACNSNHPEHVDTLTNVVASLFGATPRVTKDKADSNCITVTFNSVLAARLLLPFGKKTEKKLPPEYMFDCSEYQHGLLDGLLMTDGSACSGLQTDVCNTSPHVVNLTYWLLELTGKNPKIYPETVRSSVYRGRVIQGRSRPWQVRHLQSKKNNNEKIDKIEGYRVSRIREFKILPITSACRTFDIEVDSDIQSFVAENIIVHNSQGGLGDVLMTLPTVKAIKNEFDAIIDYATDFNYLNGGLVKVLRDNPYIRDIIKWQDMKPENYDAHVDLTCPCVLHEKPHAEPINRIDLFARHAGVNITDSQIDYYIQEKELEWAENYLRTIRFDGYKLLLVQPCSSTHKRDLPLEVLQKALAQFLGVRRDVRAIVITHGTDSYKTSWNYSNIHQLRDKDIREIAAIMNYCDLVWCPDSSILHMAGALRKKSLSFFGPTDPRARVNHYPDAVAVWPGQELHCTPHWFVPCRCEVGCWKMITAEMLMECSLPMIDGDQPPRHKYLVFPDCNPTGAISASSDYEVL
jgi:ADP-heptose:LPS heptosyltransferase